MKDYLCVPNLIICDFKDREPSPPMVRIVTVVQDSEYSVEIGKAV